MKTTKQAVVLSDTAMSILRTLNDGGTMSKDAVLAKMRGTCPAGPTSRSLSTLVGKGMVKETSKGFSIMAAGRKAIA